VFFIKKRIIAEALYIKHNKATIRETAVVFNLSKSTIHKDMSERLLKIEPELYLIVKNILNENLKTRHLKGGEVTKSKYKLLRT